MKTRFLLLFAVLLLFSAKIYSQFSSDTIQIEKVVVTGNRVDVARENVPLTISVIDEEAIENSQESKILPLISKQVPGVFVTERGVTGFGLSQGSAGMVNVRGVGGQPNTQVLMLVDGHPQYMGIFGHPLPDSYVTSDVEKVEIIRGPASILYGSNAMGGVVNLITKTQKKDGFKANAKAMYGSHNTQKYAANGGYKKGKFDVFASVNHDRTNGHRDSSDFHITNGFVKAGYNINSHFDIKWDLNLSAFESQDPGAVFNTAGNFIDIYRGRTSLSIENNYDKAKGAIKLYHNFGEHEISDGFHSTDQLSGLMLYETLRLIPNNMITVGADYKQYGGMAENTFANIEFADKLITEMAGYALVQHTLFSKLVLNAGLRVENHQTYGTELLPQMGFAFHPAKSTTIKGSYAEGFRSPTMRELFMFMNQNKELQPERINNYELGVMHSFMKNRLDIEVTGYYLEGTNLIQMMQQFGYYRNTGSFENYGLETAIQYRISNNLKLNTNYAYLNADKKIMGAPEHHFYLGVNYSFKNVYVNLNTEHVSGLYTSAPDEQSYTLLNSKVTYKQSKNLSLFLSAENLTGTEYHITYGYPMPETTVFGGINVHF